MENNTTAPLVTQLLLAWGKGDLGARQKVSDLVYGEVRAIAEAQLRRFSRSSAFQPTELANELFIKLLESEVPWESRRHFYATVTVAMRRLLIDTARSQKSKKKGGPHWHITLSAAMNVEADETEVESLDRVFRELHQLDQRKAEIAELTFLLGIKRDEVAHIVGISIPTVDRELRFAKAWIKDRLTR